MLPSQALSPHARVVCNLTSPNEERKGCRGSSDVVLNVTRESMQSRPTGLCSRRGGFYFFNYYNCKAKVLLIWGVGVEFLRSKKHFPTSPPQDLINKASVTTPHTFISFGWESCIWTISCLMLGYVLGVRKRQLE